MPLFTDDITANNNDLTNNNAVAEVTTGLPFAQSTAAADFETSSSQTLSITDAAQTGLDFAAADSFTFEFWYKPESTGIRHGIINKGAGGGAAGYNVEVRSDNDKVQFIFQDGTNQPSVTSTNALVAGTWYHIACRRDVGADNLEILRATAGGSHSSEGTASDTTTGTLANAQPFELGAVPGGGSFADGVMDDVRIWNTVRSNAQLDANFEIELVGNEAGLVAYWPFESTLGGVATVPSGQSVFILQ